MIAEQDSLDRWAQAEALFNSGKLEQSEPLFRQVIASGQHLTQAYYALGLIFLYRKDWDGAEIHFKKALEADPANANAFYQLGTLAEFRQHWLDAVFYYTRALEVDPDYTLADERLSILNEYFKSLKPGGLRGFISGIFRYIYTVVLMSGILFVLLSAGWAFSLYVAGRLEFTFDRTDTPDTNVLLIFLGTAFATALFSSVPVRRKA